MSAEGKAIAALAAIVLTSAAAVGGGLYVSHLQHAVTAAKAGEQTANGKAAVAHEQAASTADAAIIADRGAQRDALIITLQQDHAHDIQTARGADAPVDPALNDTGRRRLCEYTAYADDPGCAGLRAGHP